MEKGNSMKARRRDLPPLPQRAQRTLPDMPSQDIGENSAPKIKKKRTRKSANGVDDVEDPGVELEGLGSRRASQLGDSFAPEPSSDGATQQRRKKKKKTPTLDLTEDQADLVNGDGLDHSTDVEEVVKKPKRKKKSKNTESQLPIELDVEEDDVITDAPPSIPQHALFSAPHGQSQPIGKVFVERNKRFQAAERTDRRKTSGQSNDLMDLHPLETYWTTRDVALRVHAGFRMLGLFCHGFLAGYAMWNVIVAYVVAGTPSDLLLRYHALAYPAQSLLYLLLAVSTVATFDRVNLAKGSVALREFVTLDPLALASFLYFSALVLSLSQQMTSDRINLYTTANGTLWSPGKEHQILQPWVTVNLVVAILVCLAWIFISTRPEMDYTEDYLMAMELEPPKYPEDKAEMTA